MKVIVSGHGKYASGLHSTIQLLAGEIANVDYIDFDENMNNEMLSDEFKQAIANEPKVVFMCDLMGGTPFKEAVILSQTENQDIAVTSGCNVGALLEVGFELSTYSGSAEVLAQKLVDVSTKQTTVFRRKPVLKSETFEDGI